LVLPPISFGYLFLLVHSVFIGFHSSGVFPRSASSPLYWIGGSPPPQDLFTMLDSLHPPFHLFTLCPALNLLSLSVPRKRACRFLFTVSPPLCFFYLFSAVELFRDFPVVFPFFGFFFFDCPPSPTSLFPCCLWAWKLFVGDTY